MLWQPQFCGGGGRCDPAHMRDNWDKDFPSEGMKSKSIGNVTFLFLAWAAESRSTLTVLFILYFASDPESKSESEPESESESIRSRSRSRSRSRNSPTTTPNPWLREYHQVLEFYQSSSNAGWIRTKLNVSYLNSTGTHHGE